MTSNVFVHQTEPFARCYIYEPKTATSEKKMSIGRRGDAIKDIQLVFKKGTAPIRCRLQCAEYVEEFSSFVANQPFHANDGVSYETIVGHPPPSFHKTPEDVDMFRVESKFFKGANIFPMIATTTFFCFFVEVECDNNGDFLGVFAEFIFLGDKDRRHLAMGKPTFEIDGEHWNCHCGYLTKREFDVSEFHDSP
jgi:hypothetical protein